jgi:hypothetical protein
VHVHFLLTFDYATPKINPTYGVVTREMEYRISVRPQLAEAFSAFADPSNCGHAMIQAVNHQLLAVEA